MKQYPTITVSAPANVMLFGEHAVLHGYRAIVCALSPRMYATISSRDDGKFQISSSLSTVTGFVNELDCSRSELVFVFAAIRLFRQRARSQNLLDRGFNLTIKSDFSHTVGLGSSAAVVAICLYALMLYQQKVLALSDTVCLDKVFDLGLSVIRSVQQRGSGSDLAASIYGGLISYQQEPKKIKSLLPNSKTAADAPCLNLFYCGYKTPTAEVISHVSQLAEQFPCVHDGLYRQMNEITQLAEIAITSKNWVRLGQLMNIYHGLMDALGVSDETLSSLVYRERKQEHVLGSKISGSGLGDCIITLSLRNEKTQELTGNKEAHIEATMSSNGLMIHE